MFLILVCFGIKNIYTKKKDVDSIVLKFNSDDFVTDQTCPNFIYCIICETYF